MRAPVKSMIGIGAVGLLVFALPLGLSSSVIHAQENPATPPEEFAYVGSRKCKKCHIKQFRSWEKTKMALSYEVLAPDAHAEEKLASNLDPKKDYRNDTDCLACHTVGFGKTGGYSLGYDVAEDKKRLLGVGCESCHGPGRAYLGKGRHDRDFKDARVREKRLPELLEAGYVPKPSADNCKTCHNDQSPSFKDFDYETRKAEGVHEHFNVH